MRKILFILFVFASLSAFSQTTPTIRQVASAGTAITRVPSTYTATVSLNDTIMLFKSGQWYKTTIGNISSALPVSSTFSAVLTNGSNGAFIPITKLGDITNADVNFTTILTQNSPGYWQAYSGDAASNHGDCYITIDAQDSINPISFIGAHYYQLTHSKDNYVDLYFGKNSAFIQCNPVNQSFPGLTYLASTATVVAANQGATSILHRAANDLRYQQIGSFSGILPVINGGTNSSVAGITAFNNITGYTAAGSTGTTSTNLVFSTSPSLITPILGVATATSVNKYTWVAPATSASVAITDGKALYVANTLTLTGTDATTYSFPSTSDAVATLTVTQTLANKALTTPTISATGFTNAQHAHTGATSGGQLTTAALSDVVAPTSYTATVTGFSGTATQVSQYAVEGKVMHLWWSISGTSNLTTFTVTLPAGYTAQNPGAINYQCVTRTADNGVSGAAIGFIANNTSTFNFFKDMTGTAFTASGTKSLFGEVFIPIQ